MGDADIACGLDHLVYKNFGDGKTMNYDKIFYWALVLFSIYLAIEILRKVLGGSWGFEEVMVGLQMATIGFCFSLQKQLSEHAGWHRGKDNKR